VINAGTDIYQRAQKLAPSPRAAEAAAFSKAVLLLIQAGRRPGDYGPYAKALEFNRTLWTVVQADVADAANPLPDDVKNDLLSLSLFVDRQTVKALAEPAFASLEPLIEIDRNLARGLRA
jgi:flagellar biosynthesis activator protein FlaF